MKTQSTATSVDYTLQIKQINKQIKRVKSALIKDIKATIQPFLYESGWSTGKLGKTRPLKLVALNIRLPEYEYPIQAVTEYGVIVDSYCAGVQEVFEDLSLESLLALKNKLPTKLSKLNKVSA